MEFAATFFLVFVFFVFFLIFYRKDELPHKPSSSVRRYSPPGQSSFEAKGAKKQTNATVLAGRAYVIDGDTIVVQKTQVRLFGIDAPELNHPYGNKARWGLVNLCKGKTVRAEVSAQDIHGRVVAKCYLADGRDLSAEMVKAGLAIDWPKFSGGQYRQLEVENIRKKLWLADARQNGRMDVWERFEARKETFKNLK